MQIQINSGINFHVVVLLGCLFIFLLFDGRLYGQIANNRQPFIFRNVRVGRRRSINDVAVARLHLTSNGVGFADHSKFLQNVLSNQLTHLIPSALLRHTIEFVLQLADPNTFKHRPISRRGSVKSDLLTGCHFCLAQLFFGLPGNHEGG